MIHWIVLILLILVLIYFINTTKTLKGSKEGFGDFYNKQKSFQDRQGIQFHDTTGKEILHNSGINLSQFNAAIQHPELYLPKSKDRDYTVYLQEDPENAYTDRDKNWCRSAKNPSDLPKRVTGARIGCGWYFVANPSVQSVGTLGTYNRAMFPETLPAGGEWIWDLNYAQKKENIKFCKKYKSCHALNIPDVKKRCSFCTLKGYMVPVTLDGAEKYPDDADGSCGSDLMNAIDECDRPPLPPPSLASNGTNCGTLGVPSNDNAWRKYTKEECDSLGGNFYDSGECLIKTGGSFSWDCRGLNIPAVVAPPPKTMCSPQANGSFSRECIVTTAKNLGFSVSGGYLQITNGSVDEKIQEEYRTVTNYQDLQDFLGFKVQEIDRDQQGFVTIAILIQRFHKIYDMMTNKSLMLSGYAKWLVNGGELPDPCVLDAKFTGPFETVCLQQAFRTAGCQASGKQYPTNKTKNSFTGKTWDSINAAFRNLFTSMKSPDINIQDDAVSNCLGVDFYRPAPPDDFFDTTANMDRYGADIKCTAGLNPAECRRQCINDPKCKAYNVWPNKSGCCLKTSGDPLAPNKNVSIHVKKNQDYKFYQGQDSGGSDMNHLAADNIEAMMTWCNQNPGCKGFNTNGYMKSTISPKMYWTTWTGDAKKGLYVKLPKYLGCYKDTGDRAIPTYRGDVSGDNLTECAKIASANGDDTIGLQYFHQCFTGKSPAYDKYGAAKGCEPNGGGWTNQVYKLDAPFVDLDKKPFTYIGCFNDTGNRAIPDPKHIVGGDKAVECAKIAMSKGHNIFGVQNGNECFTGKDPDYDRYGPAGGCGKDGGAWTNQVYVMGDKLPPKKAKYTKRANADSGGNDIGCFTNGESADFCKAKCDADPNCKGYNYVHANSVWGPKSGCCYKNSNLNMKGQRGIDYYVKEGTNDGGYKYQPNVDHGGSDIQCMFGGESVAQCRQKCDANPSCKAINYIHPNTFWGGSSGCCLKHQSAINNGNMGGLDFWAK